MNGDLTVETVERIDKEMDSFDKRLIQTEDRLRHVELSLEKNSLLTEQNTAIMEKFNDTMGAMKEAMIKMSLNADKTSEINRSLSASVDKLAQKIENVDFKLEDYKKDTDKRIQEQENKNMIDTRSVFKSWLSKILVGGGILTILYEVVIKFVK